MNDPGQIVESVTERKPPNPAGLSRQHFSYERGAPLVSVVVPHYNDLDALQICLAGLRRQKWPANEMEIIVADNNSACGLDAVAKVALGCNVVHAPIQGAGPARNAGAAASRGAILAFIDSDCDPSPNWIKNGVAALETYDFAGGFVETAARNPARPTAVEAWEIEFGFNFARHILTEGYTGSGNMWVWRHVFESVGGFRAGIAEDMDWSFRATKAGFRLGYEPKAAVRHLARADWPELLKRWRRVAAEHYALTCEQRAGKLIWLLRTAAMPVSIIPHLFRIYRSQRLRGGRTRFAAAGVLIAHRFWRTGYMLRLLLRHSPECAS